MPGNTNPGSTLFSPGNVEQSSRRLSFRFRWLICTSRIAYFPGSPDRHTLSHHPCLVLMRHAPHPYLYTGGAWMVRYAGMKTAVREVADRWMRGSRALLAESQPYGYQLAAMLRRHENDNVAMFDDPLEAALFFVLIELVKEKEEAKRESAMQEGMPSGHGFW